MKFQTLLTLAAATGALAAPSPTIHKRACSSPVTLSGNPFTGRTLFANRFYAEEVEAAVAQISDSSLAAKAAKVKDIGTFMWAYVAQSEIAPRMT